MAELTEPNWRPHIFEALDELRTERIGRPTLGTDDRDLVDIIEDLMDMAYAEGVKSQRRQQRA